MVNTSLAFCGVAILCLFVADLEISTVNPWYEMGRLALGIVTPDFFAVDRLGHALLQTVAFALLGVAVASVLGFGLALIFHSRLVRMGCAVVRAIHELFWGLIFLQIFGLSALTGLLAIAIPYSGIFAKVYSEILEEADSPAAEYVPRGTGQISAFLFARIPDVWAHLRSYTSYRFECGLRSSAILGFIGLPTLGFHLESMFKQGLYSEVSALLILFYVLIATIRLWMRSQLVPLYLLGAPFAISWESNFSVDNIIRFVTSDIIPSPIRDTGLLEVAHWNALGGWIWKILNDEALIGIANTVILTQIALVATGALTLLVFPVISRHFLGPVGRTAGHVGLVVTRSTPEYILAFILLQLWGPSMLPAIVALSLHNAAIIGHLIGRHTNEIDLRPDSPRGVDLYAYEIVPRVYGQFLAFLFYRWEVIMRETAILGILGVHTLGFYIDSAIEDIRLDKALFLIALTACLNLGIDAISRGIRGRLRLSITPEIK